MSPWCCDALTTLGLLMSTLVVTPGQPKPMQPGDYTPAKQSAVVTWQMKRLAPPSPLYVGVDDTLRVLAATSQSNEVVTIGYRLLRAADGVIVPGQFTVAPASTRAVKTATQQLAEGFLLSVSCTAAVATTRGQTFVRVALAPAALGASLSAQQLMADYATTAMASAYPNGRVLSPSEGPGWINAPTVNPAVGTDFTITVPTNARWRLLGGSFELQTSAAAANRLVEIRVLQNLPIIFRCAVKGTVTASQLGFINVAPGSWDTLTVGIAVSMTIPISQNIILLPGGSIQSVTTNLQGGDSWVNVQAQVEEWLDNV